MTRMACQNRTLAVIDREGWMTQHRNIALRRLKHGWSKSLLVGIGYLSAIPSVVAGTEVPAQEPGVLIDSRVFPYIAGLILAHAAVPLVKYGWSSRVSRKSYKAFLSSNINSAKIRFGTECSHDFARKCCPKAIEVNDRWLLHLEQHNAGVPEVFLVMVEAIERRFADSEDEQRYVPFLAYAGMPTSELNHEHPIWLFSRRDNAIISKYLVSELQVERTINDLYKRPLGPLATSDDTKERKRWSAAALVLLEDLAEHYVNLKEMEQYLGKKKP